MDRSAVLTEYVDESLVDKPTLFESVSKYVDGARNVAEQFTQKLTGIFKSKR